MKVLLIEQDKLGSRLYSDALKAKGCEVRIVATAQKALHALDAELPNCIVLELDLKLHNGFEFLYEFCSQDDWKHLPIVVHTSVPKRHFENSVVDWDELNVVDYLYKPDATLSDLQNAVVGALSHQIN